MGGITYSIEKDKDKLIEKIWNKLDIESQIDQELQVTKERLDIAVTESIKELEEENKITSLQGE